MPSAKAPVIGPPVHTGAQSRIIEAARALFAEHGISGTSLQMIADELGVTKAAVYHQYNTKDEIVLAVERRRMASILQRDPVMLRFLDEHEPFRRVMQRVNRVLMGGALDARARVQAASLAAAIAGAVLHPLVLDLDDESLRSQLLRQLQQLLPNRRRTR